MLINAICAAVCVGAVELAAGASLTAEFIDRDGAPVDEVVVYALPTSASHETANAPRSGVMDQRGEQFAPHVLVVQTGATIEFPNHDSVNHHVYSFSEPKTFELPLYKGSVYPPMVFDRPGIVVLGCNIHDHMEAHIVVVDTPYFSMSGRDGVARIDDMPPGEYVLHVWTPRLAAESLPGPKAVRLADGETLSITIRFTDRLRPVHTAERDSLNWSRY
jgi:plastocyanin